MKKREIDIDRFTERYNSGATHAEICEEFDISLDTLRKRIKELGLPRRREPLSVDIEEFRAAYYAGLSSYKLSEKFGICRSTVTRIVKALKLRENEIAVKATRRAQNDYKIVNKEKDFSLFMSEIDNPIDNPMVNHARF